SSSLINDILSHKNLQDNLSVPGLVVKVLSRDEGILTSTGSVRATTRTYTGRSANDKCIVRWEWSEDIFERGPINKVVEEKIFRFNGYAGADKKYQLPIQVINEFAWHNLFAKQLFVRPNQEELTSHEPEFTVLSAPTFKADPSVDGTNSEAFVLISFKQKIVLIGGTE